MFIIRFGADDHQHDRVLRIRHDQIPIFIQSDSVARFRNPRDVNSADLTSVRVSIATMALKASTLKCGKSGKAAGE